MFVGGKHAFLQPEIFFLTFCLENLFSYSSFFKVVITFSYLLWDFPLASSLPKMNYSLFPELPAPSFLCCYNVYLLALLWIPAPCFTVSFWRQDCLIYLLMLSTKLASSRHLVNICWLNDLSIISMKRVSVVVAKIYATVKCKKEEKLHFPIRIKAKQTLVIVCITAHWLFCVWLIIIIVIILW